MLIVCFGNSATCKWIYMHSAYLVLPDVRMILMGESKYYLPK